MLGTDPTGLEWIVKRDGGAKAEAIPSDPDIDTVDDLARLIGLDAREAENWLTITGDSVSPILPIRDSSDPIGWGYCGRPPRYFVPNTVLAVWLGDLGAIGRVAVHWGLNIQYLEQRGFKVEQRIQFENSESGFDDSAAFLHRVSAVSAAKELHGFFGWGHGYTDGSGFTGHGIVIDYEEFSKRLHYKMGAALINACYSNRGDARVLLVSTSPSAVFGGHLGILDPSSTGVGGIWEGKPFEWVSYPIHWWHILRPGAQGTKK